MHGLDIKVECVVFDVAKFIRLCADANPNALEILFADEVDWMLETPTRRMLETNRHQFLTKKVQQTFLGYAMAQFKKIKSHRKHRRQAASPRVERLAFKMMMGESCSA